MAHTVFVGGYPYTTTREVLTRMFATCGTVLNVKLITDRESGKPKGFGFIDMSTSEEAEAAIAKFQGFELGGRVLNVRGARPVEGRAQAQNGNGAAAPGFVERRSGKDRRKAGGFGAGAGERREGFAAKKKWAGKPGGFSGPKKWGGKGGGFGGPKKFGAKKFGGPKKFGRPGGPPR